MKEIVSLILELADQNIDIYLEQDKLKIDAPDDSRLDDILPKIRSHREELMAYLSGQQDSIMSEIVPAGAAESYPLSSSQRRLWALGQLEESNIAYNIPSTYVFEGNLNVGGCSTLSMS